MPELRYEWICLGVLGNMWWNSKKLEKKAWPGPQRRAVNRGAHFEQLIFFLVF